MYSKLALSTLALTLTTTILSFPLQPQQNCPLTHADTVNFIAKTIGPNPSPSTLPNINNWLFVPAHTGAGQNTATLLSPTTASFNSSLPGYFRNGTDVPHGYGGYVTAGYVDGTTPYSLFESMSRQANNSNPGAYTGFLQFNAGVGTNGIDISEDEAKLITSRYVTDTFYACLGRVEGSEAVVVGINNRYADGLEGCWFIELVAQCAGRISDVNREAFPAFVESPCYVDAGPVVVEY